MTSFVSRRQRGSASGSSGVGAIFWRLKDAEAALVEGRHGRYLPEEWFREAGPIPGAVYGLRVDPEDVLEESGPAGEYTLLAPAPITGKII